MRYLILSDADGLAFIRLPDAYMYQLVALIKRLYKEIGKLTVPNRPELPVLIAECGEGDIHAQDARVVEGLDFVSRLEARFAGLAETEYPLISLLTEIRALKAQLEFLRDEEDGA